MPHNPLTLLMSFEFGDLEVTKTEAEWNAQCDAIRARRHGTYPPDWYARVVTSGLSALKKAEFNLAKGTPRGV